VRERELLFGRNMPVRNISVLEGSVTVAIDAAFDCYDKTGRILDRLFLSAFLPQCIA
jgi:hypothetical protein